MILRPHDLGQAQEPGVDLNRENKRVSIWEEEKI